MKLERGSVVNDEVVEVLQRRIPFDGSVSVPGDKSITHRALFFGALHNGQTIIRNPSPALDVRSTLEILRLLGYYIDQYPDRWELDPTRRSSHAYRVTLDCGNSGTTARLATGFLTGERGEFTLIGDESLSRRPMERVADPLRRIGHMIETTNGAFPVAVIADWNFPEKMGTGQGLEEGERDLEEKDVEEGEAGIDERDVVEREMEEVEEGSVEERGIEEGEANERKVKEGESNEGDSIEEAIDVASAQVHGAIALAAARSDRGVLLRRTKPMRDHTLRIAPLFGVEIEERGGVEFIHPISREGYESEENPIEIDVPGDVSSAAFLVAAALLVPGSDLTIVHVGLNPTRIAFLESVKSMGGTIEWSIDREFPEPVGTIRVRYSSDLRGIAVGSKGEIPVELMMDELPLLAFVGSQAKGETIIRGAGELRLKESDRITATISLLGSLGILAEELEDGLRVTGPQRVQGGGAVDHFGDHRLAMLAGVAGLIAEQPVVIPEPGVADVSWPGVWDVLK